MVSSTHLCVFNFAKYTYFLSFFSSPKTNLLFPTDKPGKPEGPLEVSDIHADHVKLKWNKPKHTGGLPLSAYVVEKMDTLTGKWVPAGTVDPDTTEATVTGQYKGWKRY